MSTTPKISCAELGPMDEYNKQLLTNTHPADWTNPTPKPRYNMVVVGAGTAGLVTAAGVAGLGGKVAIVERYLFGGDCLNFGCVPSKTLIAAARSGDADFPTVMQRVRRVRSEISHHDAVEKFRDMGIDVFLGDAAFSGPDTVTVAGETLRFARACIATGARAVRPDIEGLAEVGYYTNETIFSLTELPPCLVVLGSGPLGCELAQAFARLGSEVTIIARGSQLMSKEDPDAARIVAKSFAYDGVRCVFNAKLKQVSSGADGKQLLLAVDGKDLVVTTDAILVGYGRAPNVDGLGLETAGVEYDPRNGVKVDDHLRTTNKRIYAAGDVCLKHKFTHTADATARIVIQNALFWGRKKLSALTIPWCTYTDPEIAHVGLYKHDAKERGIEIDTFTKPFADNDRALTEGQKEGFVRVHVKKGSDRIVGATIVGRCAGDMISELSVAMVGKVGLGTLAGIIHPYPTRADTIKEIGRAHV